MKEFTNINGKLLQHLANVQKARCHEVWIYLIQLCIKYSFPIPHPKLYSEWIASDWANTAAKTALSSSMWAGQGIPSLCLTLSADEKWRYNIKFIRMIEAKREYEKVGGRLE